MASRRTRPRRFLLPILFAAVLVAEVTGFAVARSFVAPAATAPASFTPVAASVSTAPIAGLDRAAEGPADFAASAADQGSRSRGLAVRPRAVDLTSGVRVARASTGPAASSTGAAVKTGGSASSASYRGTNRVWIPSLGINRSIQSFPCSRTRPPDAGVYRWGCAGRNNVYLLSHAWSTFKPLHDAYNSGRLRKGMKVIYADGASRVHTYSVIWWKVTAPTTAASWAWASLSTPSMTLQTCVGSKSQYRLMVRLVQVD